MRPSSRLPAHRPIGAAMVGPAVEGEDSQFFNRPCFTFNRALPVAFDDKHCSHCQHYLTARCPHIDEFLEDVEDLGPE